MIKAILPAASLSIFLGSFAFSQVQAVSDTQLLELASAEGFTYFRNNPTPLPAPQGNRVHGNFDRVRFNETAQSALSPDGTLPEGASFPPGSLIVKETFKDENGEVTAFSIMLKSPDDPNSTEGWVWGEYSSTGSPLAPVKAKGNGCVSCHGLTAATSPIEGDTGNRDRVRTFGVHR